MGPGEEQQQSKGGSNPAKPQGNEASGPEQDVGKTEIGRTEVVAGTVGDLLQKLTKIEQNLSVVISRDPEGNGYSTVDKDDELCTCNFDEQDGEIADESDWQELEREPEDYVVNCVTLWPGYADLATSMKVSDLVELLAKVDPNLQVVLSRDPEGNGYATADLDYDELEAFYFDQGDKEIWSKSDWDEEQDSGEEFQANCVVLRPTR